MRKLSFKAKTTVMITLLVTAVCVLSVTSIVEMSRRAESAETRQALIKAVERNVDEIEYKNGILEIENDFAFYSGGVYCEVFDNGGKLIDGKTPYSLQTDQELVNGRTEKLSDGENEYYIYETRLDFTKYEYEIDIHSGQIIKYGADVAFADSLKQCEYKLTRFQNGIDTEQAIDIALSHAGASRNNSTVISVELPGYENMQVFRVEFTCEKPLYDSVWIRGTVPADSAGGAYSAMLKALIIFFPALILIAALGAYIISKRTIQPVEKISKSAKNISSGNDLSKRIDVSGSSDEISTLAKTFNDMLERLQLSFESEKRFTSDASHELRTPLAVIKAECEYALSENADREEKEEAFVSINEQTEKMTSLVNALLSLTRAEQGIGRFNFQSTDLSSLVKTVCNDFSTTKSISLNTNISDNIGLYCDETLIKQLLINLLSNADKYGRENGFINVILQKQNNDIILSVEDNGIGIKKEDIPKITGRFYRADESRGETEGFGLGLSLAENIASLHNGKILIESEYGKGSKFTVKFFEKN